MDPPLAAGGGLGTSPGGGLEASPLLLSGSDVYAVPPEAPVDTPPRLFNLGIPPAKRPPSCGAWTTTPLELPPLSLLLRA